MGRINGDTKVILARLDERFKGMKEYMKEEFKEVKMNHITNDNRLNKHSKKISSNKTAIKYITAIGGGALIIIITIIFAILK